MLTLESLKTKRVLRSMTVIMRETQAFSTTFFPGKASRPVRRAWHLMQLPDFPHLWVSRAAARRNNAIYSCCGSKVEGIYELKRTPMQVARVFFYRNVRQQEIENNRIKSKKSKLLPEL